MENQLTLTIMPDYNGTGIYSGKDKVVNYAELSLPDEIKSAFEDWISLYWDSFYHPEDFASEEFEAIGLEISRQLKSFFKESAKVIYQGKEIMLTESDSMIKEEKDDLRYLLEKINFLPQK